MFHSTSKIPLSRKLVTTIIKKGTEITEAVNATVKKHGLTLQQFNVLRILRGRKGAVASLQDVSKEMIHANSNTTRVIDKLVDKKYVKRVQCPKDRRQIELTITEGGLNILKILDEKMDATEESVTKNLDDKTMKFLLEQLEKL